MGDQMIARLLLLSLFILVLYPSVQAFDLYTTFSKDYRPITVISCRYGETLCSNICSNQVRCEIKESYCRDCGSFDLFLEDIFTQIGSIYTSEAKPLTEEEMTYYFKKMSFMSLTSKSIFNIYSGYDDLSLRDRMKKTCPGGNTDYPILFLTLDESSIPQSLALIACRRSWDQQWELFPIDSTPELLVNPF